MRNTYQQLLRVGISASVLLLIVACAEQNQKLSPDRISTSAQGALFPDDMSAAVQEILPSIREVVSLLEYDVEEYRYVMRDDSYIKDPASPVGYRLKPGKDGVRTSKSNTQAFGAGLIVGESPKNFLLLTSRHVIVHEDTVTKYFYKDGKRTDIPRIRAFLRHYELGVRANSGLIREAEVIADEVRSDLALISFSREHLLARPFDGDISMQKSPQVGQLGLIVGYPQEILQVGMGIVSPSPYPGNFSVSVSGNFGFSGGPVFLYSVRRGISFAGICKSIPGKRIYYIAPDSSLQITGKLLPDELEQLRIEMMTVLNSYRIYAVNNAFIFRFLREYLPMIKRHNFVLSPRIGEAMNKI